MRATARPPTSLLLRLFVASSAGALALAAALAIGWYRSATAEVGIEDLDPATRQQLTRALVDQSPGVHRWAYFEPRLGYTLVPRTELEAFGATFETNRLGYRTGRVEKGEGTFRVLFVGDSWTFGHGLSEEASFPAVFERIASRHAGLRERKVEAWTLALPGYNTIAELAGLWFFFDQLEADAVVLCPTTNDNTSMPSVLPNGSTGMTAVDLDELGDRHLVSYWLPYVSSFRFLERWRHGMDAVRDTAERLEARDVPFLLFFVSHWEPSFVHRLVLEAGLSVPYLVAPSRFTVGDFLIPGDGHANAAANEVFGRNVYQALAQRLGWPSLPARDDGSEASVHLGPPPGTDWVARSERRLLEWTEREIPTSYAPAPSAASQCVGPMDASTGLMGRATTVLVRRAEKSRALAVTVRPVAELPALYPMTLTVSLPAAGGGTTRTATISSAAESHRVEIPIPDSIPVGAAIDVVLVADRVASMPGSLWPRSLLLERIEPTS